MRLEQVNSLSDYDLDGLVEDSLSQGYRFVQRLVDEYNSGINRFDKPGEALFVFVHEGQVIGVGGLNIDPYLDRPEVGRVRHLYVNSGYRNLGIGKRLLQRIMEQARLHFALLTLYTDNPIADRIYRANGFVHADGIHKASHMLIL